MTGYEDHSSGQYGGPEEGGTGIVESTKRTAKDAAGGYQLVACPMPLGTKMGLDDEYDDDADNIGQSWRIVDELTVGLSEPDCRAIYTAVAIGVGDGWRPTRTEIANLVAFAAQQAGAARHNDAIYDSNRLPRTKTAGLCCRD